MTNLFIILKSWIKKKKFLYSKLRSIYIFIKTLPNFLKRNKSLISFKKLKKGNENIFIFDARSHSIIFDSVLLLARASNFFYNNQWVLIIYEDDLIRYSDHDINNEIYSNSLINIFLQSVLILPNPPNLIKFIHNSRELLKTINKAKKIFPENYSFFGTNKQYLVKDFKQSDFENFKLNQPTFKATKYHSNIFENYLNYRDIKQYITITIRTKSWGNPSWNTDLHDLKIYLDFIKKNNLENIDILILPDTQQDVPKEIIDYIKKNSLKYHLYHHGSFSIPMRFLAYSNASFNLASTNGPATILFFIDNNSFFLIKDEKHSKDVQNLVNKFNEKIFLGRKFIIHKNYK
jgi:hypothetical protein